MKKLISIALFLVLAVSVLFAGGKADDEVVDDGAPKGKLVIYTSMYKDIVDTLTWVMLRQFPGCDIEFVYGGTGQLQDRVAAEEAAKRLGCDMLLLADPSWSIELKQKGMLHSYVTKTAETLAFEYDSEGYWYPVRVSNMILAFNPEKYEKDEVPNSFHDFAYGEGLAGEISMGDPQTSGTTLAAITALRDKYGYEYFDALGRQNIKVEAGTEALAKLEAGEYRAVMVLEESVLQKQQEEMSALQIIYPDDGTIMIPSTIMTIAEEWSANKNTRTAEAITDWFLDTYGQNAIVDSWMHSVRRNFRRLPYGAIPTNHILANSIPINWENCLYQRGEIQSKFEELVRARN